MVPCNFEQGRVRTWSLRVLSWHLDTCCVSLPLWMNDRGRLASGYPPLRLVQRFENADLVLNRQIVPPSKNVDFWARSMMMMITLLQVGSRPSVAPLQS